MNLLTQSKNTCSITALAMLLDSTEEEITKELGHDGLEIWFPCEDIKTRGIHIQELIDVAYRHGFALINIQAYPLITPKRNHTSRPVWKYTEAMLRFSEYLDKNPALIITDNHAVAWDGNKVYDPNGKIADLIEYEIREIWLLKRLVI